MDKQKQGKRNRASGSDFERRVKKDLEEHWTVIKNPNNVIDNKFTQGKSKFNPFTKKVMMMSGGFPDFIIFRLRISNSIHVDRNLYEIIGVECKVNGHLDKEEKEKCDWLIKNQIFSKILIASKHKEKNKIKIRYTEWK